MASRAGILRRFALLLALCGLAGCAGYPLAEGGQVRATAQPDIRVTPAPTQNVPATATAYARQIIPTPTPAGLYIVKPGDTLTKIADEHETTVDEILALNNLSDPNTIQIGQELRIPSLLGPPDAGLEGSATSEPAPGNSPEVTPEPPPGETAVP